MVRVITYETSRKEWDKSLLQYTCKRNSFELDVLGQHKEWNGTKNPGKAWDGMEQLFQG